MKKEPNNKNNFADVLAMDVRYAVLTKSSRVQVLVKPTVKQLRKRGIKGWHLFGTVDSQTDAAQVLDEVFQRALSEIESPSVSANGRRKKGKPSKTAV